MGGMTEDDRKDIETYLKILDYTLRRHEWRANIEWKLTIAVWTLLFAGCAFFISQKAILPLWAGFAIPLPIVAFHIFWLDGIYKGHDIWKARMNFWADKAQFKALGGDPEQFETVRMTKPQWRHSSAFAGQGKPIYLAVTLMLSFAFALGPRLVTYHGGSVPTIQVVTPQATQTEQNAATDRPKL
jgi:hypothetical protein